MGAKYEPQYAFGMMNWCKPDTIGTRYFDAFYGITYKDATRIARDFQILTTPPLNPFRFQTDKEKKGESLGWQKPDFDDKAWKTTDITEAINPNAENQITLLCTRTFFNELGTGGLLGPVLLYQEKS